MSPPVLAPGSEGSDLNVDDRPGSLEQAIETERGRLSHAQSILGCLHAALLSAEQKNWHEPGCADVAAIAQKLVREAAHRLDYIYLQPLIDALRRTGPVPGRRRSVSARR
jgi:hypothetical protein